MRQIKDNGAYEPYTKNCIENNGLEPVNADAVLVRQNINNEILA